MLSTSRSRIWKVPWRRTKDFGLKTGGPSDDEWESYLSTLKRSCGMEELLKVYQDAYNRYIEAR